LGPANSSKQTQVAANLAFESSSSVWFGMAWLGFPVASGTTCGQLQQNQRQDSSGDGKGDGFRGGGVVVQQQKIEEKQFQH